MAKIISFDKGIGKVSSRISDVECVYNVGEVEGKKYVSLSTFGSSTRKNGGSASQVLHFDKESAEEIIKILKNEFQV